MAEPTHDEIVNALRKMTDDEARDAFAEARGSDRTAKQEKAAAALRQHGRGITLPHPGQE